MRNLTRRTAAGKGAGRRAIRGIIACVATLAAFVGAQPATGAGQAAEEFLKPIVTQRQYTDLIRGSENLAPVLQSGGSDLLLTREQRMIVELVFEDYRDAVEDVRREADREADRKGRRIVAEALAGRRVVSPDELRHYRLEVLKVYRPLPAKAKQLAERLVEDLRSVLTADQRPKLDEQMPAFRRMLFLHPRHLGRGDYEYAGDGVDVLLLVEAVRRDSGELADVPMDAMISILREYEAELDALLLADGAAHYEAAIDARLARIAGDERALREAERRSIEQWRVLYELNERTVDRIKNLTARHVGEDTAHQWRQRFEQETFAWMFTPTRPDRIYQWIVEMPLDDDRLAEAEAIYDEYHRERWPLMREAADIMIRARSEFETVVYSMMDPSDLRGTPRSLYRELLLNSGRMASVQSRAVADLESLLGEDELRLMRREVRGR